MPGKKEKERYEGVEKRVGLVGVALVLAMACLGTHFWYLQVLSLAEFSKMAEDNRVWQKRLEADRGLIYARNGEVLADNRASADVVMVPAECPEELLDSVCERLKRWIEVDIEELKKKIKAQEKRPFTQILVKRDVTKADRVRIEENLHALPGITIIVHPQRRYLFARTAGQLLGYLGEINREELDRLSEQGYFMGDLIGKDGLERFYEDLLHGSDGYMLVTKYASGQPQLRTDKAGLPVIARRDSIGHLLDIEAPPVLPLSGESLYLTLDIGLQQKCEEILVGERGSIIVLDADTGAVLAMASEPGYDPGVFVNRGADEERKELLSGSIPNRMTHRGYREVYPPGSVFKVMLAAAALEAKVIDANTRFYCNGSYMIDGRGRAWNCWNHYGHGGMNVVEALAYSCDVFFYNVGRRLEAERIVAYANKMGLGVSTGIDVPGEQTGLVPGPEWKAMLNADKPEWEQRWYPGETVNLSIGQGSCTTTPLQNAVMMACIINGGYRVRPFLNRNRQMLRSEKIFSDETLEIVIKGLRMCVEKGRPGPTGTGRSAQVEGVEVIGKTGTAQVTSLANIKGYARVQDIPYEKRHHAWFVAGVLDRSPKIAIAVLIEHGHAGGTVAAPIAAEVIKYFYQGQPTEPETLAADRE